MSKVKKLNEHLEIFIPKIKVIIDVNQTHNYLQAVELTAAEFHYLEKVNGDLQITDSKAIAILAKAIEPHQIEESLDFTNFTMKLVTKEGGDND